MAPGLRHAGECVRTWLPEQFVWFEGALRKEGESMLSGLSVAKGGGEHVVWFERCERRERDSTPTHALRMDTALV